MPKRFNFVVLTVALLLASASAADPPQTPIPGKSQELVTQGFALLLQKKMDEAFKCFDSAVQASPMSALAYQGRGTCYWNMGKTEQALADLDTAIKLNSSIPVPYWLRAMIRNEKGELDKAVQDFDKALEINPKYVDALQYRGQVWDKKNELDKAIQDYSAALTLVSGDRAASIYHDRARAFFRMKKADAALMDLDQTLALDPSLSEAWYLKGRAWMMKKELEKAKNELSTALKLKPSHSEARLARAQCCFLRHEWELSLSDFDEVLRLNPELAEGYLFRAVIRAQCPDTKLRDGKKALEDARRACELTEWKKPFYLATLASAYAELGHFDEAIKWQKKAMEDPNYAKSERFKNCLKMFENKEPIRVIE